MHRQQKAAWNEPAYIYILALDLMIAAPPMFILGTTCSRLQIGRARHHPDGITHAPAEVRHPLSYMQVYTGAIYRGKN
jgi:hypothetical protein